MPRVLAVAAAIVLAAGSALVPAVATAVTGTKTLIAGNDTYVAAGARSTNYGSAATLRVDASPTMKAYLRFTLPAITGTITKAVLRLTPAANVSAAFDLRAVGSSTWSEGSVTFATAPAVGKSIAHSPKSLRSGRRGVVRRHEHDPVGHPLVRADQHRLVRRRSRSTRRRRRPSRADPR